MPIAFHKILIPVDFSINTETAVKKAIGFIDPEDAFIHLVHIVRQGTSAAHKFIAGEAEKRLAEWKETIKVIMPEINVKTSILRGSSIQQMIIEAAGMLTPDLIIIGKQGRRRNWLFHRHISPDRIAQKSNCPVLTAKPGSADSRTKIIVIPIRHFVPERKLELAVLLAKKYRAQVHLLVIHGNNKTNGGDLSQAFLKAYHQLREKLYHPIEYFSVDRNNTAKATLDYAELIMADMILVNPAVESGFPGITGSRHISDLIAADSKIQVLDVMPYE